MPTARFKIGDFSQLAQVSVRTLRLYDELGLIHPAETDRWTGYRYYTLDQLPRLTRILALKDLGLSLGQIAHLMKNDLSAKQMRRMLEQKQAELEQQLSNTQSQMQRVRARLHQIENETAPPKYEVVLKTLNALAFASIRVTVPHLSEMANYRMARQSEMYATLAQYGIKPLDPELFVYHLDRRAVEKISRWCGQRALSRPARSRDSGKCNSSRQHLERPRCHHRAVQLNRAKRFAIRRSVSRTTSRLVRVFHARSRTLLKHHARNSTARRTVPQFLNFDRIDRINRIDPFVYCDASGVIKWRLQLATAPQTSN
ncbi:MAG: MerR family transcriptional regulator [Chloroflexi bacterium]|nr:MerR family transcriptional regulator [Chloroflexota bacterium]